MGRLGRVDAVGADLGGAIVRQVDAGGVEAEGTLQHGVHPVDAGGDAGIDRVNAVLQGPLSLNATRIDLADNGAAQIRANSVNAA